MADLIGYTIEVKGVEDQIALLNNYDQIADEELTKAMQRSTAALVGAIRPLTPVFQGFLRRSIGSEIIKEAAGSIVGRVGSSLKDEVYPAVMEFGRRPNSPPPPSDKLVLWVHRKGLAGTYSIKTKKRLGNKATTAEEDQRVAYLVARSIGKRGIKGKFFMRRGFENSRLMIDRFFAAVPQKITQRLSTKG